MSLEISESDWDRTFLDLSSKTAEPLCWAYGLLRYRLVAPLDPKKFDNCDTQTREIATRALIAVGAFFLCVCATVPLLFTALVLGATSKIFRAIGFSLQKNGYTHVRGSAPEKKLEGQAKILTWNICGIGGVNDWRLRLNDIVAQINAEDPDVLVLQEVYDTALAEALIEKLGSRYAHFFTHLGTNVWGSTGGGMVISKCAHTRFTNESFKNNDWTLNRTFTTLDIKAKPEDALPCARIIGTHLIHDSNPNRMAQVAQIVDSVFKETFPVPTVIVGDLNLERDKAEEGGLLNPYLRHGYVRNEPTATNELARQWEQKKQAAPGETIDYVSLFKRQLADGRQLPVVDENIRLDNCHLVKAFDETYNTRTALSDHHGVAATLVLAGG